jgi:thiamine-phosphate pyrophosphorylase
MKRNVTACSDWRLYVIVDRAAAGTRDLAEVAEAAIRGGADVLQLRDKTASNDTLIRDAKRLLRLTRPAGIPLIINDRPEVTRAAGAEGVHLGQEDMPLSAARRLLGPGALLGKSTHSLAQALAAEAEGADYIGCGPVFATPTKPDYGGVGPGLIAQVTASVRLPVVCIGGIDQAVLPRILAAGAQRVAVVRAVCAAADPEAAARALKRILCGHLRPHGSSLRHDPS